MTNEKIQTSKKQAKNIHFEYNHLHLQEAISIFLEIGFGGYAEGKEFETITEKFGIIINIFDEEEQDNILELINLKKWKQLRDYIYSKSRKLKQKGILADYLYYFLELKFRFNGLN